MKKILLLLFVLSVSILNMVMVKAQSCTLSTTVFTTQAQIDQFPVNYPGCSVINSNITVQEAFPGAITNLNGFLQIKQVNGFLKILDNTQLTSLSGLDSLHFVDGDFKMENNPVLQSLSNLINVDSVSGDLKILRNNSIINLSGIDSIQNVGHWIYVNENASLKNLVGFPPYKEFYGRLRIATNPSLTSLQGLDSLEIIQGLWIYDNDSLPNVFNLSKLHTITSFFEIVGDMRLQSFSGLDSLSSVGWFLRIEDLDALQNLTGLGSVNSIGGYLKVKYCQLIKDLTGLGPVDTIPGHLYVNDNPSIESLNGLQNIRYVGRDLEISRNDSLTDITALIGLHTVDGYVKVDSNSVLTSLSGLDSIDATIITDLIITNNPVLSFCNVKSVCDYLDIPSNPYTIFGNDTGCMTNTQILNECFLGSPEVNAESFILFPNPANGVLNIMTTLSDDTEYEFELFDMAGRKIYETEITSREGQQKIILPEYVHPGLYNCVISNDVSQVSTKIIITGR